MSTLGQRLKTLRASLGLTQEDVSKHLNIARATLANWEIGRTQPDPQSLQQLADFFSVSVDYLLGRTNEPNPAFSKVDAALADDPELFEFWKELKKREDLQLFFKQVRDLSPNAIKRIMRIIKAIEDEEAASDEP